jgi:hypothetical protein
VKLTIRLDDGQDDGQWITVAVIVKAWDGTVGTSDALAKHWQF